MHLIEKYLKVNSAQILIDGLEKFIGKSIRIIISEVNPHKQSNIRKWKSIGSVDLGGKFDKVNIRDYAHD